MNNRSLISVRPVHKTISLMMITVLMLMTFLQHFSISTLAAGNPQAGNVSTNFWGDGGQVTFDLSGCDGYMTITAVVEFNSNVSSASGWGFDSYHTNGKQVTATVRADGGNSWGFNSNVGIQVQGSGLSSARVVSVTGSGTYSGNNNNNNNNNNQNQNNQNATPPSNTPVEKTDFTSPATTRFGEVGDDWLTTKGSKIVDANGTEVWLTGVNWFGYNTGTNLFDGLWNAQLEPSITGIADHGFNLMRIPISAELLLQWKSGNYPTANYNHAYNSNLDSLNSLEIFDYALTLCEKNGIKVMIDIHSANTDASGHNHPVWYTDKITEDQYVEALAWIAERYKNYDTIIAYDLKNEPHGKASESPHAIWNDSNDKNNWKRVAERAGNAILDKNPHALIVIEGIQIYPTNISSNNFTSKNDADYYNTWWGGNLMAVKDFPIDFGSAARNRQIVYSPHDYGPLVYQQPWFSGGFDAKSLYKDAWYPYWLYISEENIAPILIGEWGGFMSGDNLKWMEYLRDQIGKDRLNYTFWCYNANSGDTGGLVKDDFMTWDDDKYNLVKPVIWQDDKGRFISLDHKVKMGANGISLTEYSGSVPASVINDDTEVTETSDEKITESSDEGTVVIEKEEITGSENEIAEAATDEPEDNETITQAPDDKPADSKDKKGGNMVFLIILLVVAAMLLGGAIIITMNNRDKTKKDVPNPYGNEEKPD